MDINTSYGPPTREVYEQQQRGHDDIARSRARAKEADCAACGPHDNDAVIIDEKLAKVLELALEKKGSGNAITKEDLENLKASGELTEDLKTAADQLIADLKAAEAEAAAGAAAEADRFGFTEEVFKQIQALLEKLLKQTGKNELSIADVEAYAKSDELSEEDKAVLEQLVVRLREAEAEAGGETDA